MPPTQTIDGYEQAELVDVIFQKTKAFVPSGAWNAVGAASTVLDFGGGCGLHYKQANSATVRWAVVETPAMVARAKELATDRLRFFSDVVEAAAWLGPIDLMHSDGALQYVSEPAQKLNELCALQAKRMIWSRMALSDNSTEHETQSSFLGDNGPGKVGIFFKEKTVTYTKTKIPELVFLKAHHGYALSKRGPNWFHFQIIRMM